MKRESQWKPKYGDSFKLEMEVSTRELQRIKVSQIHKLHFCLFVGWI